MSTSTEPKTSKPTPRKRVNVRTPEVMNRVKAEVETHYRSKIVEKVRERGGILTIGNTTVRLAKQFGFCYGVERAIDLAYASRRVFPNQNIYLIGEIIHNPEVNRQLVEMGIQNLVGPNAAANVEELTPDDVVIVPAFGAETSMMDRIRERGCQIVDTTCGDVMSVWKRVRNYAKQGVTSIIHGKASHEETRATASRATQRENGHYLIILTLDDTDYVCDYIRHGGDREAFLQRFAGAHSDGFDPDIHLNQVGVANQTTMLKSETEELQRRVAAAIQDRDSGERSVPRGPKSDQEKNFQYFDTICGATQERQDALFDMLDKPMDVLLVVGGYNSSNTTHLVEIGERQLPTFFIRDAACLRSFEEIVHFDIHRAEEVTSTYTNDLLGEGPVTVGITAGASCPANLIEATILKAFQLRGVTEADILAA